MDDTADGINSLESIKRSDVYTSKQLVSDDSNLRVPFPLLSGEQVEYLGSTTEGIIALSTFRLFVTNKHGFVNVPIGLIDSVEKEMFVIYIYCKTGPYFRCSFLTNEKCLEWHKRLLTVMNVANKKTRDSFACAFFAFCMDYAHQRPEFTSHKADDFSRIFDKEVDRMGFDLNVTQSWRISYANNTYSVCPSYPKLHIVPAKMTDDDIIQAANFRAMQRFPSVVWRDRRSGMAIARCSQPKQGLLSWRCSADETFFQLLLQACAPVQQTQVPNPTTTDIQQASVAKGLAASTICESQLVPSRKVLVIDARTYTSAWANRAKGGGVECPEYYPHCEILYMNLANIHSIRKSFVAMRSLCTHSTEQTGWLSGLEATAWLQHISGLMKTALLAVNAIDTELRPVVVHCSDGWDRTPQIVSLAQLLLDPYYRTIEGFCVLIQREWLDFGHKFADRCGHYGGCADTNERCPVFLLWLDCVHQLLTQLPAAFQFNMAFLVKLVQHVYAGLFGTFLTNTAQESETEKVRDTTFSVWSLLLHCSAYVNGLYKPVYQVLRPSVKPQALHFWDTVYALGIGETVSVDVLEDHLTPPVAGVDHLDNGTLPRTRSCDNIAKAITGDLPAPVEMLKRHNSDSSLQRSITRADQLLADADASVKTLDLTQDGASVLLNGHNRDGVAEYRNGEDGTDLADDEKTVEDGVGSTETLKELASSPRHGHEFSAAAMAQARWARCGSSEASTSTTDLSRLVLRSTVVNSVVGVVDPIAGASAGLKHLLTLNKQCPCIAANVVTSAPVTPSTGTTTCITKVDSSDGSWPQNGTDEIKKGIARMLDPDGLTHFSDPVQRRLREIHAEYIGQLHSLTNQLQSAKRLLDYYYKGCNTVGKPGDLRDDLFSELSELVVDRGEVSSTPASDASWDQVDEQDAQLTLWVPDHAASHCARCHVTFSIVTRKHHCRKCGHVFCGECSKHMVPLPEQHLNVPARMCDRCYEALHSMAAVAAPPVATTLA